MSQSQPAPYLTLAQVAKELRISPAHVIELVEIGALPVVGWVDGHAVVARSTFEAFQDRREHRRAGLEAIAEINNETDDGWDS